MAKPKRNDFVIIPVTPNAPRTNMLIGALLSGGDVIQLAKQMIDRKK